MDGAKCKQEKHNRTAAQVIQGESLSSVKIKEEEIPTDISTDGSSNRNTPERYLNARYSQQATGADQKLDAHIKEENLNVVIVDIGPEVQDQVNQVKIKEEETPRNISPANMNRRKGYLRSSYKRWWCPAKSHFAAAHKMDFGNKKTCSEYLMTPQFLKEFIDLYRSCPCLWDVKFSDYSNKQKRSKAYETLVDLCRTVCPTANIQFVKHKIANLRTVFKKEFNKVELSKKSATSVHDIYVPRLWYYDLLKFTIGLDVPKAANTSASQELHQEEEPSEENPENLEESTNLSQVTSNSQSDDVDFEIQEEVIPTRKQKKRKSYKEDNLSNELLSQAAAILSKNNDEYDAFGITIASKLRRMEEKQRLLAEVLITDVLYKGMVNQLNEETYISQYQDQYYHSNPMS